MPDDDAATVRPLRADQLEPALRVIEAAQHLAATGGEVADTLAGLARQLTEFIVACRRSQILRSGRRDRDSPARHGGNRREAD